MSVPVHSSVGCCWYVVRTRHRQEARAEANLKIGRIETFLPWVRTRSRRRRFDREALFPQYLFARFDAHECAHDVTFTRGVQNIVRVGGELATLNEDVIGLFRSKLDEHGFIPLGQKLEPGEQVTIERGPFAELAAVVERILPAKQRVIVLLATVATSIRVEVPTDDVRPLEVRLTM